MKSRIIFFFAIFLLLSINDVFSQIGVSTGEILIESGISRSRVCPVKAIYIFNGTLVKDSVSCIKLLRASESYKTKTKVKGYIPDKLAKEIGLDADNYAYIWTFIEIKDVIIDIETMKLFKIK